MVHCRKQKTVALCLGYLKKVLEEKKLTSLLASVYVYTFAFSVELVVPTSKISVWHWLT